MRRQVGHITSEGEYFHQLDVELIDKMRRRTELEEQRRCMERVSQIHDPKILATLEKLGYKPATAPLLCLTPLIQVAWASGSVNRAARRLVLAMASTHGVAENTPAHNQLVAWLDHAPGEEFFDGSLRAIHAVLESLPETERQARQHALIECCMEVALTGWHIGRMGVAERRLIENIQAQLQLASAIGRTGERPVV
jgi:hypothetical protein